MKPLILIVEDISENRAALYQFLRIEFSPDQLKEADSVEQGIRIIEEQLSQGEPITVVLTDFLLDPTKLNDTGGFTVIEEALRRDPQVLVILYSVSSELDRQKAFQLGAFDIVERNTEGKAAIEELLVKLKRALRQRESAERIAFLGRFFDRQVFQIIEQDPLLLALKERMVTICFWDIQGFSRFCEELRGEPQLVASFLRKYSEEAARIIFQHHGVLDKFIGDGVMALFGVLSPEDSDSGASAAVRAALEFRKQFNFLVQQCQSTWVRAAEGRNVQIGVRCGIHTGRALVGCAGTDFRDQFTALGANVNKAARFESLADGSTRQILVSETTKLLVENAFDLRFATEATVKNIDGVFKLFAVHE